MFAVTLACSLSLSITPVWDLSRNVGFPHPSPSHLSGKEAQRLGRPVEEEKKPEGIPFKNYPHIIHK